MQLASASAEIQLQPQGGVDCIIEAKTAGVLLSGPYLRKPPALPELLPGARGK